MKLPPAPLALLAAVIGKQVPLDAVPTDQWATLIGLAGRHGLAPFLLYHIHESRVSLPGLDPSPLKEAARLSATRYVLFEAAQAQVETALRQADLPAIWFKGIALAQSLYPDPTLRPMSDLDVLVPHDRRQDALKVVQRQGYHFDAPPGKLLSANDEPLRHRVTHHYHLVGGPAQTVILELHNRLLGISNDLLPLEEVEWFWGQTSPCRTSLLAFSTLNPTAHLLYLCAHAELQHADFYLLRYFDLHLLVTRTPPDWHLLIRRAAALRWTSALESALQTSIELFGTPTPPGFLDQLQAQRPATEDTTRVWALKTAGSRWVRVRRLLSALSLADQLHLVVTIVFPAPAYMRSRYAVAAGWPVWPYYLYRWLDQAREVVLAIKQRWILRYHKPNRR